MHVPPFGTHDPGALAKLARRLANAAPSGAAGRIFSSLMLRLSGGKRAGPYDVTVFGDQRVRLHPMDNLSEKRVYKADAKWEVLERATIARVIAESGEGIFTFVDIGANAGLYTLAVRALARREERPFFAVAVEPQAVMLDRFRVNLVLSGALEEVDVHPVAITDTPGAVRISVPGSNLGEGRIGQHGGDMVDGLSLYAVLEASKLSHVDVMKLDIEGAERAALEVFFDTAPKEVWPRVMVIEREKPADGPLAALLVEQSYSLVAKSRMNGIWQRESADRPPRA